ncbi:ATP-dependent DNA helicase UvrD, putative (UvrD) [Plasmodium ovale curtisi]|uniref:DNA 3'-5' helicase n=1 Tax=Plasmodium ovale curtisi TaxID=864141 RepID=A0A1A8VYQ6_PLAOA|nr:ATP-dependent DNA helicase UvrD, putative (UvrD) [Plasmodium ovale curtisi]
MIKKGRNQYGPEEYNQESDQGHVDGSGVKLKSEDLLNNVLFGNLSIEQKKIVQVPLNCNLCIIACPGSGKTSTLTARIIRSIIEKKKSVVCITFTNYAANDLKEKIMKKINCLVDLCISNNVQCKFLNAGKNHNKKCDFNKNMHRSKFKVLNTTIFIGTIHSFCRHLLVKHKGPFKILTDAINSNVLKLAFKQFYITSIEKERNTQTHRGNIETGTPKRNDIFDMVSFFNSMKNNFTTKQQKEMEDEEEAEDEGDIEDERYHAAITGETDESDEEFANYLYNIDVRIDEDTFAHVDCKNILKKKHILFLKKKIRWLKYVDLYNLNVEINDMEKQFYDAYKDVLQKGKHVYYDFDDLLIETYRLMQEDEKVRTRICAEWGYIFCDEFQDVNTTQFNILRFFARSNEEDNEGETLKLNKEEAHETREGKTNGSRGGKTKKSRWGGLTVIGDDDQSIYAFRGAHVNVFERVIKECNCSLFKLGTNFRSTQEIVRTSRNLILHNGRFRIEKELHTNNVPGQKVKFHVFKTRADQISYILAQIIFLKKTYNYKFADFVILSRTNRTLKETLKSMSNRDSKKRALKLFLQLRKGEKQQGTESKSYDHHAYTKEEDLHAKNERTEEYLTDMNIDNFDIPVKELNKKKSFFGSKEIIELVTLLRFLLNVNDNVIFTKTFKIVKNDKMAKIILQKLSTSHFISIPGRDSHKKEEHFSLFNCVKYVTHLYVLSKRKGLDSTQKRELDKFTETEIKNIADFFFFINYFQKCISGSISVYNLVIELMQRTNFVKRLMVRIERKRERHVGDDPGKDARGLAKHGRTSPRESVPAIGITNEGNNKTGAMYSSARLTPVLKESAQCNKDFISLNVSLDECDKVGINKKRSFYEYKEEKSERNGSMENYIPSGDMHIQEDLQRLFNVSEGDLNHIEVQNVFLFLEMTRAYKPTMENETCSNCLIYFLNDFKNNIHENMLIEKVTLTTIHKSKGLEWKVVFIVNVVEGEIPQVTENNNEICEERKIFYVGITRAKWAFEKRRWGDTSSKMLHNARVSLAYTYDMAYYHHIYKCAYSQKEMSAYFRELFPSNKYLTIKFRTDFRNTIYDLFLHRKWELTTHETEWNLCWSEKDWISEVYDTLSLKNDQFVNHFRNFYELTRKDLLAKNIKRLKKQSEKNKGGLATGGGTENLDITPVTFVLPLEYNMFLEEFKKKSNCMWIMKPIGKSQGKGIFLFDKISQIREWSGTKVRPPEEKERRGERHIERSNERDSGKASGGVAASAVSAVSVVNTASPPAGAVGGEHYVVQEYISNPLLIGGKKFDIRLYVLVLSYSPLTIYIYRSGFARFSHSYFRNEKNNMNDITMHLTNVSIQKNTQGYDDTVGGKWFLRELFLYMKSRYGQDKIMTMIKNIESCIVQSFLAVHKVIINDKNCFELYGFDILIDSTLKPWLIEVNSSPSFSANTTDDYNLKFNLLDELMTLINIEKYDIPHTDRLGDFDCIYRNGHPCSSSRLGAHPSGTEHLKQIAKGIKRKSEREKEKKEEHWKNLSPLAATTTNTDTFPTIR